MCSLNSPYTVMGRNVNYSLRTTILFFAASSILCLLRTSMRRYSYSIHFTNEMNSVSWVNLPNTSEDLFIRRRERERISENFEPEISERDLLYKEYLEMVERNERNVTRQKKLPDVIGIGVEKCGSGPLRWMLLKHPMILSSVPAEMHYFTSERPNGIKQYLDHMPEATSYELVFEKTPAYFVNEGVASRIHKHIPEAKIVVILCDPVNRTYSDYVQETRSMKIDNNTDIETLVTNLMGIFSSELKRRGHDPVATLDYIRKMFRRNRLSHLLSAGLYYYHLKEWLDVFGRSNIHIVDGEKLIFNPGPEMEKLQDFLGIPKLLIKNDFVQGPNGFYCYAGPLIQKRKNKFVITKVERPMCMASSSKGRTRLGNWKYQPSAKLTNKLSRFFKPANDRLFAFLGRTFHWQ